MIERMFALSLAHLSQATAETWLWPSKDITAYPRGDDGWFVRVPDSDPQNLSRDLAECFALARGSGCDWVTFGPDKEPLSILPVNASCS